MKISEVCAGVALAFGLSSGVWAATSTTTTVETKTITDNLAHRLTTTVTTTVNSLVLGRPDTAAASLTGCPSTKVDKLTGVCLKTTVTDTGLITTTVPGIKTVSDTVITTVNTYSNFIDLTGLMGSCSILNQSRTGTSAGTCTATIANAISRVTSTDLNPAADTVQLGQYQFYSLNPGSGEKVNWFAGTPGQNGTGGGIGMIVLPVSTDPQNPGSFLGISRVDGKAFNVESLTLFNNQISTTAPDMLFTGVSNNVDTVSDAQIINTYPLQFTGGNFADGVWHNVTEMQLDGAANVTWYLKDFRFSASTTSVLSTSISLPVPEADRTGMLVAGLVALGAVLHRRRRADTRG
jgi:hypothetical protein